MATYVWRQIQECQEEMRLDWQCALETKQVESLQSGVSRQQLQGKDQDN